MKKGLLTLFVASVFAASVSSFALAPTVRDLPDITVGDQEDNIGATDNNWFVFTNAFQFDAYASDPETPVAGLKWSFDELEGTARWYSVNGVQAIHLTDTSSDDATSDSAHRDPAADLRAVSAYASFRDIVFSPPPSTGPFADPTGDHSAGKLVRFLVSDTEQVTRADSIIVNTVDDGADKASGAGWVLWKDDTFDTSNIGVPGGATGWTPQGLSTAAQTNYPSGLVAYDYDATNGAYRGRVYSSLTTTADVRYRAAGWFTNQAEWMPYNTAGSDNYIRCKYYLFAQPNVAGAFADKNIIPNFRARVANRFVFTANLEVSHHSSSDPGNATYANELAPSTNPASPTLYRVDLAPIPVPYLYNNGATEGYARMFENFGLELQEAGYIGMSETAMGYYPKALVEGSNATLLQSYSSIDDIKVWVPAAEKGSFANPYNLSWPSTYYEGMYPNFVSPGVSGEVYGTYSESTTAITMDTVAVHSDRVGIVNREFNPDRNTNNFAAHPRVEEGKQYKIRFHLTSTQATNRQASITMRARSIKFAWSQKLELGSSWSSGGSVTDANPGPANTIAHQIIPGLNTMNPYKEGSETNGGWYTVILHSPIYSQLGAQTNIRALPGPGVASDSRRDIRCGLDLIDSLSSTNRAYLEAGNVSLDKIEVYSSALVADN